MNKYMGYSVVILALLLASCATSSDGDGAPIASNHYDPALGGNLNGNITQGSWGCVVEREGQTYFFGEENHSIFQQASPEAPPVRLIFAPDMRFSYLTEQNGYLYFINFNQLCRLSIQQPEIEIIAEADGYSLYGQFIYYYRNNQRDLMYVIDLAANDLTPQYFTCPEERNFMVSDTMLAGPDYIIYSLVNNNGEPGAHTWYLIKRSLNGEVTVLDAQPGRRFGGLQIYDDKLYYMYGRSIYCLDLQSKVKQEVYKISLGDKFIVFEGNIYIREMIESGVLIYSVLDTAGNIRVICRYESIRDNWREGTGILEEMHILGFEIADGYIYTNAWSVKNGSLQTTRFPIAGEAEGKKEEWFYGGEWHPYIDFAPTFHHKE
jgi:hypothetical protein